MTHRLVSVVVVSWDRPDWLRRCLLAVGQMDHPSFEVVVVACASGVKVAELVRLPVAKAIIPIDKPNISVARNLGIGAAHGEVVAFIDDDAVPEPTWVSHLVAAFDDPSVVQAGGVTLGRNGISVQHAAARVSLSGVSEDVPIETEAPSVLSPSAKAWPRLHGTNMAIRRSALVEHGGFDERFSFYLDETDLTMRIAQAGGTTMHVPKAIVHHASGPSRFRSANRVPLRLFEIGRSAAVFHAKHVAENNRYAARADFLQERKCWLLRHMQGGTLTPDDVFSLMRELTKGYALGTTLTKKTPSFSDKVNVDYVAPEAASPSGDVSLVVQSTNRRQILEKAAQVVREGTRVTVFDFTATAQYHRVSFSDEGYWHHTGGIFGRMRRDEPLIKWATRAQRVSDSLASLDGVRSAGPLFAETEQ
ncbi:glycosyltransferase family 2 protein [Marivita hallyeonensis]|uniref:Glycosyltransferase, GT2 family n=1 Tax=Marivita hallyeonensis TaxID=996342 RepID=A0A1M5TKY0_9RHOB|nr:glycosyltransferase [Marivita hallyeonensis]SHH51326.1 Glycosyltransferase, GT2 family [Marivita hallyeonensis]